MHMKIPKRFKCDQCNCNATFYSRSGVKRHVKTIHLKIRDFICNVCGKTFKSQYQLSNHMFVHSNEKFKCLDENCDKYFASPMSRKKHMEMHSDAPQQNTTRLKCELCELSFVSKITLRNHHQFKHLNIRNFKCVICAEAFKSKKAYQMHYMRHSGEKPFSCPYAGCERKFRSQSNQSEHMRTHTDEKPFLCEVDGCNKRFKFSVDFRRHKLKQHGINSNTNCPCKICGEIFSKNSLLVKHMKTHTV